jgi:hypothetical protein
LFISVRFASRTLYETISGAHIYAAEYGSFLVSRYHPVRNSTMSYRRALIVHALLICALSTGCDRGPKVEFGTVKGTVRVKGQPKGRLMLRFLPDREKGNGVPSLASGTTDAQGNYTLHYEFQGKEGDGAAVGWHRVTVVDTAVGYTPQGAEPKPSAVPFTYGSPATTPILKEVKTGDQTIDLDIK